MKSGRNHRLEVVKKERVPSRSSSVSFKPSKKSTTHWIEYLALTVEPIVEPVPPAEGGVEPMATGEDTYGTTSG
jgi:hypothetical protein